MKSWRVAILPYMEQQALYQQYDSKQPWDSPQNRALGNIPLPIFRCPSDPGAAANSTETNYVRIVGKDTVGGMPNEAVKVSDIRNGTSNTIMVVEVSGLHINWEEPRDVTVEEFMDMVAKGQASHHSGGFQCGDGRWLGPLHQQRRRPQDAAGDALAQRRRARRSPVVMVEWARRAVCQPGCRVGQGRLGGRRPTKSRQNWWAGARSRELVPPYKLEPTLKLARRRIYPERVALFGATLRNPVGVSEILGVRDPG